MFTTPLKSLLYSRKFLLLILDVVISLSLYFFTKYAAANLVEDVKTVIALIQPVFVTIIGAIAYEDVNNTKYSTTSTTLYARNDIADETYNTRAG